MACIRGCSAQVAALDHFLQALPCMSRNWKSRTTSTPSVTSLGCAGRQKLAGQSRRQPARRFVERSPALLGSLLDRLQELEPFGGRLRFSATARATSSGIEAARHSVRCGGRSGADSACGSSMRLEMSEQKRRRSGRVDSGCTSAMSRRSRSVRLRPSSRDQTSAFFNWSRSAMRTTWIRCVSSARRRLTERKQRPDVGQRWMSTQHFGGGAANERVGVAQMARGQLGQVALRARSGRRALSGCGRAARGRGRRRRPAAWRRRGRRGGRGPRGRGLAGGAAFRAS